jgi:hypothetical protein
MKPFNLEAAKRGDPLITRGGETVKFICVEPDAHEDTRLLVLRNGRVLPLYVNGKYDEYDCDSDVFMAVKKKTVWVNIYRDGSCSCYDTEDRADDFSYQRVGDKAWPLEIEE